MSTELPVIAELPVMNILLQLPTGKTSVHVLSRHATVKELMESI